MAENGFDWYDGLTFLLLCDETIDSCFDEPELDALTDLPDPGPIVRRPSRTEQIFQDMLGRQCQYSPEQDYIFRLRNGDVNANFRRDSFEWIAEAHAHLGFNPLSLCLSMNYMDRFLSLTDLPKEAWVMQLLAVACLYIAVKRDEIVVPPVEELQVANPQYLFHGTAIEEMELHVLTILNWQTRAITPFSFVYYFISKITDGNPFSNVLINKASQLILCAAKGMDFMEYKSSEIAAGVAIALVGEIQETVDIDKAISENVDKDRVAECVELVKEVGCEILSSNGLALPDSPVGVLEANCFSMATYDIRAGSQFAHTTTVNNNVNTV